MKAPLAVASGLVGLMACGLVGCGGPLHYWCDHRPGIVRFPFLEEHGYCVHQGTRGHACDDAWCAPNAYDAVAVPPPCELGPAYATAADGYYAYPAEVRSAAFTEVLPPTPFVPVPTRPVFGPH